MLRIVVTALLLSVAFAAPAVEVEQEELDGFFGHNARVQLMQQIAAQQKAAAEAAAAAQAELLRQQQESAQQQPAQPEEEEEEEFGVEEEEELDGFFAKKAPAPVAPAQPVDLNAAAAAQQAALPHKKKSFWSKVKKEAGKVGKEVGQVAKGALEGKATGLATAALGALVG